jgi:glycosyltransferase involved in cell wall biosynthesis
MGESRPHVSVIIPAYNEAGSIGQLMQRLSQVCEAGDSGDCEVILVDDGSTDGTAEQVTRSYPAVTVVQHPYNIGAGAAVKTGIRKSRGEILVLIDADGQHDPRVIPKLVEQCGRYDMVVGARQKGSQASWHRSLANSVYNRLATYVTGNHVQDLTSGFRAIRRDVAARFVALLPNGFSQPTTITLCAMRGGFSVLYFPIETAPRTGKSKIKLLSDGTKFLLIIAKICMLFSPMKIFLPVSVYLFLMGTGYYGYTFFEEHRFTNMSMLLLTTSVMVFMMGLVAEQIAQMRFERTEEA